MKKQLLNFIVIMLLFSCSITNSTPDYESTLDSIYFKCGNEANVCKSSKYSIYQTQNKEMEDTFELIYKTNVFFKGDKKKYEYLYEVFESRFLLITPIKIPHYLSSPLMTNRDYVFVYDLKAKKAYHFEASGFRILIFKSLNERTTTRRIEELKKNGNKLNATIAEIDVLKGEVNLLLEDLVSVETVKLIIGSGDMPN